MVELDLDQLRSYRENEVRGNAYRRPGKYQILTDTQRRQLFIQADYSP